jgi:hypothetical protein
MAAEIKTRRSTIHEGCPRRTWRTRCRKSINSHGVVVTHRYRIKRTCYCSFIRSRDPLAADAELVQSIILQGSFWRSVNEAESQVDNDRFAARRQRHRSFAGTE